MPGPAPHLPPPDARGDGPIGFIARETAALAARVAALEALTDTALGSWTREDAAPDRGMRERMIVAFQDLDLIRQSLEDLARLGQALTLAPERAAQAPDAELAETLVLRDLRVRLLGGTARTARNADDAFEAGALSLFAGSGSRGPDLG